MQAACRARARPVRRAGKRKRLLCNQPDRHEPDPRALVGAGHTERRHTGLHGGSISVGASVAGGGGPRRGRCWTAAHRGSRWEVNNMPDSAPCLLRSRATADGRPVAGCGGEGRRGVARRTRGVARRAARSGSRSASLSVYTGAIARILVGDSAFKCCDVTRGSPGRWSRVPRRRSSTALATAAVAACLWRRQQCSPA